MKYYPRKSSTPDMPTTIALLFLADASTVDVLVAAIQADMDIPIIVMESSSDGVEFIDLSSSES